MTNDGKMLIYIVSDIHFHDTIARRLYEELEGSFLHHLEQEAPEVDMVVIAGDLFDRKVMFNSDAAMLALKFVGRIVDLMHDDLTDGHKPVRILKGTRTHDHDLLNTFNFMDKGKNVEVVNTITGEEVVPHFNVLYIPEEYPVDWQEYYSDWLACTETEIEAESESPAWDVIFLHGMIDFEAHSSIVIDSERPVHSAPVFPTDVLLASGYVTIAGHVHVPSSRQDRIFYCGSYTRFAYGEDHPKGWIRLEYDAEIGASKVLRIENTAAPEYKTVRLSEVYDPEADVDENVKSIQEVAEGIHLRLDVDMEQGEKVRSDLAVVRERFADDDRLKLKIDRRGVLPKPEDSEDQRTEFLAKPGTTVAEAVHGYVGVTSPDVSITLDEVKQIISPEKES